MKFIDAEQDDRIICLLSKNKLSNTTILLYRDTDRKWPCDHRQTRNLLWFTLMTDAGLRVSELRKLRIHHFWFGEQLCKTLLVDANIAKNKKSRAIPLTTRCRILLAKYRSCCLLEDHTSGIKFLWSKPEQVKPPTCRMIQLTMKQAGQRIGIDKMTPHTLRHTFATRLLHVADIETVRELMGHKHLSSTQVYTHSTDKNKNAAISKMESNSLN